MRVLALSDIHNNISAVQRLRAQETDTPDVMVVAGDLGSDSADEIMAILGTYQCPILYVLGNWDHEIDYERDFGPNCHHLHHTVVEVGGLAFMGFSGVQAHWGRNPIAAGLLSRVESDHRYVLTLAADLEQAEADEVGRAKATSELAISILDATTTDRRRRTYKDRVDAILAEQRLAVERAAAPVRQLRASRAWKAFKDAERQASVDALAPNRAALAALIRERDPRRCVVVTHDRLTRTDADMADVSLFLFGHRHGFSDTTFRTSRFINVSALDDKPAWSPFGVSDAPTKMGIYARITVKPTGAIMAEPCRLEMPFG